MNVDLVLALGVSLYPSEHSTLVFPLKSGLDLSVSDFQDVAFAVVLLVSCLVAT